MALRIGKEQITRERGYLYYIGKDGRLWKTPTKLNRSGRKAPVTSERYKRVDGYMYFLDKKGFVSVARMLDTPVRVTSPEDFVDTPFESAGNPETQPIPREPLVFTYVQLPQRSRTASRA